MLFFGWVILIIEYLFRVNF